MFHPITTTFVEIPSVSITGVFFPAAVTWTVYTSVSYDKNVSIDTSPLGRDRTVSQSYFEKKFPAKTDIDSLHARDFSWHSSL